MDVTSLRAVLATDIPLAGAADTPVTRGPRGQHPDGAFAVMVHAAPPACGPGKVTTTTLRQLAGDAELIPVGSRGRVSICDGCSAQEGFDLVSGRILIAMMMVAALENMRALASHADYDRARERNDALRRLRLRRTNPGWTTAVDEDLKAWFDTTKAEATADADRYAATVREAWAGPMALATTRVPGIQKWACASTDPLLDDALAVAEHVGTLANGKLVLAVPATLLDRDDEWANLGPAVTGPQLRTRLAAIDAASLYGLPDQEELATVVAATTAALD